jgi:hypothetical protein
MQEFLNSFYKVYLFNHDLSHVHALFNNSFGVFIQKKQ